MHVESIDPGLQTFDVFEFAGKHFEFDKLPSPDVNAQSYCLDLDGWEEKRRTENIVNWYAELRWDFQNRVFPVYVMLMIGTL